LDAVTRKIRWAGVEFQPDLKNPKEPVALGVILHEVKPTGETAILIMGRVPRAENRPAEFQQVTGMTMDLAAAWVDSMAKDLLEAPTDDPFSKIATKWRWNLYAIEPATHKRASPRTDLYTVARELYESFVGLAFTARRPPRAKARRQSQSTLPPAWLAEEITKRRYEQPDLFAFTA
jgi:hypothetical protein